MKRAFDLVVALVLLVLAAPVFAVVAVLVNLDSKGPVFFHSPRVGRRGRIFRVHKFRTMRVGAVGPAITTEADARVTRVGRTLRRTRLDELPQLVNVVLGEMSLVGPRPEDPRFVALHDATWRRVLAASPGITGPTQLAFADREQGLLSSDDPERDYRERVLPAKLRADLAYVEGRTFAGDLVLLLRTAWRAVGA